MTSLFLRNLFIFVLRLTGLALVYRIFARRSAVVLRYERLDQPGAPSLEEFRRQMDHVARFYNPVSLDAVNRWLRGYRPLAPNSVAVTFDNGYAEFQTKAYPILRERKIPVTLFVTTGMLGSSAGMWWDRLAEALPENLERVLEVKSHCAALEKLKRFPPDERENALERLTPGLTDSSRKNRILTWRQVKWLSQSGTDIGTQAVNHPTLSCIDEEMIRWEVEDALADLRGNHIPTTSFAYPNGGRGDFNESAMAIVRRAGFATAVTTVYGAVRREDNPYALHRIAVGNEKGFLFQSMLYTAPVYDFVMRIVHRLKGDAF